MALNRLLDNNLLRSGTANEMEPRSGDVRHDRVVPSLTRAMLREVAEALVPTPPDEVLVSAFRIDIRRRDMHTLADGRWLNDEVINFYMSLLMERAREEEGLPRVYAFCTFFFPKLIAANHAGVQRWTRAIDIFSFDILLVPVHLDTHWCLMAVDFRERSFAYYDSVGLPAEMSRSHFLAMYNYLVEESWRRRGRGIDWNDWTARVTEVPRQRNGDDCGVFTCQYAECLSRDAPISFGQEHMPYLRQRIAYEILHKTFLSP